MTTIATCPDDSILTELAIDGTAPGPVTDHVATCSACRDRVDEFRALLSGMSLLADPSREVAQPETADFPGAIGKFLILGTLRSGEGTTTYRGVYALIQSDEVALTLADDPWPGVPATRKGFESAAASLAGLDHPRIARAVDVGFFEDRPFLVHDFVPGNPLDRVLGSRPFTVAEAAAIGSELARALASAHRSGLVHGALAIESIRLDEQDRPMIVDFGTSRLRPDLKADPSDDLVALAAIVRRLVEGNPAAGRLVAVCDRARSLDAEGLARAFGRLSRGGRAWIWVTIGLTLGALAVGFVLFATHSR